jgi:hypothetical protein
MKYFIKGENLKGIIENKELSEETVSELFNLEDTFKQEVLEGKLGASFLQTIQAVIGRIEVQNGI